MALLTVAELVKRPGLANVDEAAAAAVLDDVSAMARRIATPLLDTVDWPDTPAELVPVIVAMARRALVNPLGHTGAMVGPMSWQGPSSDVYATKAEARMIRRAVGLSGASSAQMEGTLPNLPSDSLDDDSLTDLLA